MEGAATETEKGYEAYKRHAEERKALFQEAKRARLMAEEAPESDKGRDGGASASTRGAEAQREVKESDLNYVPGGWFDCPPCGEPIGLMIPSKTPMSAAYDKIPAEKRYTPKMIVEEQAALGRQIGLVINLTSSKVYYNARQFEELGVEVTSIQCEGRGSAPTPEEVNAFCYTVNSYFAATENKKFVLVHCTHGFNRTGYMICHMLMRAPLWFKRYLKVTEVIERFAKARSPGIYKPLYLNALFKYYHETKGDFTSPALPEWKNRDIEEGDEEGEEEGGVGGQKKKAKAGPMNHDDLLGEDITPQHKQEIQNLVRSFVLTEQQLGRVHHFPGSQPVSFSRDNMGMLQERRYYVTWKADGTRYMLLCMQDGVYLVSRSFDVRRLQMRFPMWGVDKHKKRSFKFIPQQFTLLDGEMVVDEDAHSGERRRRFYAYDLMSMGGQKMTRLPFKQRYANIEDFVISPRKLERSTMCTEKQRYLYNTYNYDEECFSVKRKSFYPLHSCQAVLKTLIPKLLHESDGLIFQDWEDPYIPLTCEALLKWKYSHLNSVDFKLHCSRRDKQPLLVLHKGGSPIILDDARVTFPNNVSPDRYHNKIVECSFDGDLKTWVFIRERTDKNTPNDFTVYHKVVKSIEDNIDAAEIIERTAEASGRSIYDRDRSRKCVIK